MAKLDDIQLLDSHFDTQQLDSWLAEAMGFNGNDDVSMLLSTQNAHFEAFSSWSTALKWPQVSEKTWHIRTDKHELTNNLQARLVVGARAIAQLDVRNRVVLSWVSMLLKNIYNYKYFPRD